MDGFPRYLTPSIALFEVVKDDLLPIRPIGIQVRLHMYLPCVVLLLW